MPYGAHETMETHEFLNEKMNQIVHFTLYAQQAQNNFLRQMIERHLQSAMQAYDQMVGYTQDYASSARQPAYGMPDVQSGNIQYGLHQPPGMSPQTQNRLSDRQIVSAMLSLHKNGAKCAMASALECADPNLRQIMTDSAMTCANQAYETFLFMNQHGIYQVPTLNDHTARTFLHSYKPIQEDNVQAGTQPASDRSGQQPSPQQPYQQ